MLGIIRAFILWGLAFAFLVALALVGLFYHCSQNLPSIDQLESYDPQQISRIYAADKTVIGEFGKLRRTVIPVDEIPVMLLNSFVAVEDSNFFQHKGLDFYGILRAIITNITKLKVRQGASTISQQVLKNLLLIDEHPIIRKVKEALLVSEMEERLTKREILGLYVNEIYFGNRIYGVCEAARFYFNKQLNELDIGEMAYIAGIPKNPYRYRLNRFPDKAKKRQSVVLKRLLALQYIDQKTYEHFLTKPLIYNPPNDSYQKAPYITDRVRKLIADMVSQEDIKRGGLHIYTDIDVSMQKNARMALRKNLLAYEKRHAYRKLPILNKTEIELITAQLEANSKSASKSGAAPRTFPRLAFSADYKAYPLETENFEGPINSKEPAPFWHTLIRRIVKGGLYFGWITLIDEKSGDININFGASSAVIKAKDAAWAVGLRLNKKRRAKKIHQQFAINQMLIVSPKKNWDSISDEIVYVTLEQVPKPESAIIAIDPETRAIKAMLGGFSYYLSPFNRATDAMRQPGSSFKAFVYLTAIKSGEFTPASIIMDEPITYKNKGSRDWSPKNYDGKYRGAIRMRVALANSINLVAVKVLAAVGIKSVIKTARDLGITARLTPNMTLALGSSEVPLSQMVNAYATFPAKGVFDNSYLISKIISKNGKVLHRHIPNPRAAISIDQAGMMVSLMQSVVSEGTSRRARILNRPVAGKTGTTNNQRDAWFIGYSADIACGIWTGFDDRRFLGRGETGSRAALPGWIEFMDLTFKGKPSKAFFPAPGLVHTWINPETGKRVEGDFPEAMMEVFLPGTEPDFETQDLEKDTEEIHDLDLEQ